MYLPRWQCHLPRWQYHLPQCHLLIKSAWQNKKVPVSSAATYSAPLLNRVEIKRIFHINQRPNQAWAGRGIQGRSTTKKNLGKEGVIIRSQHRSHIQPFKRRGSRSRPGGPPDFQFLNSFATFL